MDTITSPVYGTRRGFFGIRGREFGVAGFEHGARLDDGALARGERCQAALAGTGREIDVGFGGGEFRHASGDADLAVYGVPIEHQGGVRIRGQFARFAAVVIGEEEEAAGIHSFEQDHARGRASAGSARGEGHGVGFGHACPLDGAEPAAELLKGIWVEGALRKTLQISVYALSGKLEVPWKNSRKPRKSGASN